MPCSLLLRTTLLHARKNANTSSKPFTSPNPPVKVGASRQEEKRKILTHQDQSHRTHRDQKLRTESSHLLRPEFPHILRLESPHIARPESSHTPQTRVCTPETYTQRPVSRPRCHARDAVRTTQSVLEHRYFEKILCHLPRASQCI